MLIKSLGKQLIRDLQASWKKSVLLGALLAVGLYFWIPPLLRARNQTTGTAAAPSVVPMPSEVIQATAAPAPASDSLAEGSGRIGWREGLELLESDPLVRSAEIAAMVSEPFQIDDDQFPPPLLFAENEEDSGTSDQPPPIPRTDQDDPGKAPEGLTLKSTIIGVKRRAALLNGRLHFQGNSVTAEDATYTLLEIHDDHVILSDGTAKFVLEIPRQKFFRNINVQ